MYETSIYLLQEIVFGYRIQCFELWKEWIAED
jgi:hypothetical protein